MENFKPLYFLILILFSTKTYSTNVDPGSGTGGGGPTQIQRERILEIIRENFGSFLGDDAGSIGGSPIDKQTDMMVGNFMKAYMADIGISNLGNTGMIPITIDFGQAADSVVLKYNSKPTKEMMDQIQAFTKAISESNNGFIDMSILFPTDEIESVRIDGEYFDSLDLGEAQLPKDGEVKFNLDQDWEVIFRNGGLIENHPN